MGLNNQKKLRPMLLKTTDDAKEILLYMVTDYKISEPQNISHRYSPYMGGTDNNGNPVGGGKTQNLGRGPISITVNLMVVDYAGKSKEYMIEKLFKCKRLRKTVQCTTTTNTEHTGMNLDDVLLSGTFNIGLCDITVSAPNYFAVTLTLEENLESNIKQTNINLVSSEYSTQFLKFLTQRYGTTAKE